MPLAARCLAATTARPRSMWSPRSSCMAPAPAGVPPPRLRSGLRARKVQTWASAAAAMPPARKAPAVAARTGGAVTFIGRTRRARSTRCWIRLATKSRRADRAACAGHHGPSAATRMSARWAAAAAGGAATSVGKTRCSQCNRRCSHPPVAGIPAGAHGMLAAAHYSAPTPTVVAVVDSDPRARGASTRTSAAAATPAHSPAVPRRTEQAASRAGAAARARAAQGRRAKRGARKAPGRWSYKARPRTASSR